MAHIFDSAFDAQRIPVPEGGFSQRARVIWQRDRLIQVWQDDDPDDFERRVLRRLSGYEDNAGHWLWPGSVGGGGYPVAVLPQRLGGHLIKVSRAVWLFTFGSIPPGHVLDHDRSGCPRHCCSPWHLHMVPPRMNVVVLGSGITAALAARTHCPRCGTPLIEPNLMQKPLAEFGWRRCAECNRRRGRQAYAALKDAALVMGLSYQEYVAQYGRSRKVAAQITSGV